MFTDVTCTPEIMKNATDAYFSLLQGNILSLCDHCMCSLHSVNCHFTLYGQDLCARFAN